ncbi:MAG: leucyl/phenylalanyl-tRNA--protein transferase [Verrucomicrobiia bacterium]|jgi:leucyl/phenylalanyl-tRNA--protein transferase
MIEPELLLDAYRHGIFPMAVDPDVGIGAGKQGDIGWFSPDPRAIIPLDDRFHIPHGLRRVLRQEKFETTFDTDFEAVIRECAKRKEGTWISKEIIESYCNLHRLGHAHSVEVRLPETAAPRLTVRRSTLSRSAPPSSLIPHPSSLPLVGGLYGVHIGGAFFGESMFHRVTDASKVALVALVERLRARGFVLLDTQWQTPHLAQFGTYEIPKREYLWRLQRAVTIKCEF